MRNYWITILMLCTTMVQAQKVGGLFKYATMYSSVFASSPMEAQREWFVTQAGELQDITIDNPMDYKATFGVRRVARYDYENKQNRFYDGQTESTTALNASVGSVQGIEYLAQYDRGRQQGREYVNQRYFMRYLSKYFLIKAEYYRQGLVDLNFSQIDSRFRLHIGELDFSAGVTGRQHRPYGYNPVEIYLEDKAWWDLAHEYGYDDVFYGIDYDNDEEVDNFDWFWCDADGEKVADTDADFRRYIYGDIVDDYNRSKRALIGSLSTASAVFGVDYYHYEEKFWLHTWLSVIPYHVHLFGDEEYSYKNYVMGDQWIDHNAGAVFGWKIGKRWGLFTEAEYVSYWDREVFSLRAGLNYQIR